MLAARIIPSQPCHTNHQTTGQKDSSVNSPHWCSHNLESKVRLFFPLRGPERLRPPVCRRSGIRGWRTETNVRSALCLKTDLCCSGCFIYIYSCSLVGVVLWFSSSLNVLSCLLNSKAKRRKSEINRVKSWCLLSDCCSVWILYLHRHHRERLWQVGEYKAEKEEEEELKAHKEQRKNWEKGGRRSGLWQGPEVSKREQTQNVLLVSALQTEWQEEVGELTEKK